MLSTTNRCPTHYPELIIENGRTDFGWKRLLERSFVIWACQILSCFLTDLNPIKYITIVFGFYRVYTFGTPCRVDKKLFFIWASCTVKRIRIIARAFLLRVPHHLPPDISTYFNQSSINKIKGTYPTSVLTPSIPS